MSTFPYTRYLEIVFAAAGLSLSISGALTTWVKASLTASAPAFGISFSQNLAMGPLASNTGNGLTFSNQSAQLTAGASFLLIGFIVGVFHFVNAILMARGFTGTTLLSKPIATLAFVCTLIGTIVSGAGTNAVNVKNVQDMVNGNMPTPDLGISFSSSVTWDSGFGCAIAATIIQFVALLLAIIAPAPATPAASTDKPAEATPAAVVVRETA